MNKIVVIEGQVSLNSLIEGEILLEDTIEGDINLNSVIDGELGTFYLASSETHETYNDKYTVVPSASEDITLDTSNKIMERDVTVFKVPYYQTSNVEGTTVYIAQSV